MRIDRQKSLCYSWERQFVFPNDKSRVPFDQIESIVKYIWQNEGLQHPPLVEKLRPNSNCLGTGCRTKLCFQNEVSTAVIVHEVSHALSSVCTGETNAHGSVFISLYIQLLNKYLKLDMGNLIETARNHGLVVKEDARPVFI